MGERAIARTLELDPVQCTALCARSMILFSPSRGFQNRAALRALNAAIKIDPSRPTARHQRSAILWHLGFLDAAERDAEVLKLANPAMGSMHQGAISLQRGDFDLSAEHYARALELEPNGALNHLLSPVAVLYAGRIDPGADSHCEGEEDVSRGIVHSRDGGDLGCNKRRDKARRNAGR